MSAQAMQGQRGSGNPGQKAAATIRTTLGVVGDIFSAFTSINRYRITAVLVWLIGVWTTSLVINAGVSPGVSVNSRLDNLTVGLYTMPLIGAFIVQFIFTTAESPIFRGQGVNFFSLFFLVIDTAINSIVVKPLVEGFVTTGAWDFIRTLVQEFTGALFRLADPLSRGIDLGSGELVTVILTLMGSLIIAGAPEWLWQMGKPVPRVA